MCRWMFCWLLTGLTVFTQAPLEFPDLSGMKAPIRARIQGLQDYLTDKSGAPDSDPTEIAAIYGQLGLHYQAHALLAAAERAYANAAALQPDFPDWHYYLASVYKDRTQLDKAADHFRTVLQLRPNLTIARVRLGLVLLDLNQPAEALASFREALAAQPNHAQAAFGAGKAAAALNDPEAAIAFFEQALAEQPEATFIHYPLALAYRQVGDMEKARFHIGKRGEGELDVPDPYVDAIREIVLLSTLDVALDMTADAENNPLNTVVAYIQTHLGGRQGLVPYLAAAMADWRQQQRPAPALARLSYIIGLFQKENGALELSLQRHLDAHKLMPNMVANLLAISTLYEQHRRDTTKALEFVNQAVAADGQSAEALFARARLLANQGGDAAAASDLERVLRLSSDHVDGHLLLAAVRIRQGNVMAGQELLESALALELPDPERGFALHSLARIHRQAGRLDQAADHLRQAAALVPDQPRPWLQLGETLAAAERFAEAAESYGKALALEPANKAIRLAETAALIFAGDHAAAITRLDDGLVHNPGDATIRHLLARLLAAGLQDNASDRAYELARGVYTSDPTLIHGETYAMALASTGDFAEATALQTSLIAMADRQKLVNLAERLRANLARYETEQACCASLEPAVLLPPVP